MTLAPHGTHGSLSFLSLAASWVAVHSQGLLSIVATCVSIAAGGISIAYTLHKWRREK